MKTIQLTRNQVALVDDCDYDKVSKYTWCAMKRERADGSIVYYAKSTICGNRKKIFIVMHRFILGLTDPKIIVDHINRNGIDNTRRNLRLATSSQNCMNKKCAYIKNRSSQYKGVTKRKNKTTSDSFESYIYKNNARIGLGSYKTEIEAASAYDQAALKYHGEFARLNFPQS